MKYHIHIPKLLEFTLNVVCDDVTLQGKQCLTTPIPYPLYLRCIMTYAYKYDKDRYSTYRFYRDLRHKDDVNAQIGRLYPNILDHVVLDDDVDAMIIAEVAEYPYVDDAAVSIQRFASRCLAADKCEMMVNAISQVLMDYDVPIAKLITDVLLFYGAKLDPNDSEYFNGACLRGMNDDVITLAIENGCRVTGDDMIAAIASGRCNAVRLVHDAYRGSVAWGMDEYLNMINATMELLEVLMELNIIQRETHHRFSNIPSFSVLQWLLDHDVMEHDEMLIDVAYNASHYSGHYFDMLKYLIEQHNFTVPRDVLVRMELWQATDLDVFDYLLLHGADVNAASDGLLGFGGRNVLERSPLLIRYWIDKGIAVDSNDANTLMRCIKEGMTAPVLEMMIDKYSMNVNAAGVFGRTPLHWACNNDNMEIVDMLIRHGANVQCKNSDGITAYYMTDDARVRQLLISHGYTVKL